MGSIIPDGANDVPNANLSLWDLIRNIDENGEGITWRAVACRLETHPHEASVYRNYRSPLQYTLSECPPSRDPPLPIIRALLEANQNASKHSDRDGNSALHYATYHGHSADVVRLLLSFNEKAARTANSSGMIPLHVARSEEVARVLIEAYTDGLRKRSHWSSLPLHCAALMVETEPAVLRLFVKEGKRCSIGGSDGIGGLFLRGPGGKLPHARLCERMVQHIVDPSKKGAEADGGAEPLDKISRCYWEKLAFVTKEISLACELGDSDLPFDLIKGSLLHTMIQLDYPAEVIRLALKERPDQKYERDELGRLPLAAAVVGDASLEVIQMLIHSDSGSVAAASTADFAGRLPLHLAAESGRDFGDGIEDLIRAEPRALSTRDAKMRMFPFMLAAAYENCSIDCVFRLLKEAPLTVVWR